jgi:hypothetical protein
MECGDRGSGRVESMVELRTLADLVREFLSQSGKFVVLAGFERRESAAFGDTRIPFGQYLDGSVHGGAA